ncbi:15010_t:CDS:2, partial [Funneliformis geosporum]
KIKIETNTASDDSNTLSRLDGFEKQLEEHDYDTLKSRLESEYNNCMIDMKQKTYLFKYQLEEQQKSGSDDLEMQYKSRINTLDKSNTMKDKEIGKLSATISQLKKDKNALKQVFASAKKIIKVLDSIIYSKDQTIIAYNEGLWKINPG